MFIRDNALTVLISSLRHKVLDESQSVTAKQMFKHPPGIYMRLSESLKISHKLKFNWSGARSIKAEKFIRQLQFTVAHSASGVTKGSDV